MRIITGDRVDLISPFPTNQLKRLWGWFHMFKTTSFDDTSPKTEEEFLTFMENVLPRSVSYGVIDKNGELGFDHEAPIIGYVAFQPSPPASAYAHVASNRRAWGKGLIDEAAKLAGDDMWANLPELLRISCCILAKNRAARSFADRIGFHKDGYFKDIVYVNGEPASMVHYGFCRPEVEEEAEEPMATESLGIDDSDEIVDDPIDIEEVSATAEE
jgi:RimJ/RimL family protein N-acetyltransferase